MSTSILKSLPRLYLWQAVAVLFGLATQIYLARALGAHDKGILDLFLLIPAVLSSITDVGLLSANTFYAGKKTFALRSLHSNTLTWSIVVTLALLLGSAAWNAIGDPPFPTLTARQVLLALLATGPMLYVALWGGLMYGTNRAETVYVVQAIGAVVLLAVSIGIIVSGLPVEMLLVASAGVLVFKAVLALWTYTRVESPTFAPSVPVLTASMKYGVALFVGIVINILHNRLIQFLVEGHLGPAALGCFSMAVRFVEMLWLLDYVIINASLFKITSSPLNDAIRLTTRMTRAVGAVVIPAGIGMAVILPWFIPRILGDEFAPSVVPALILIPGMISWSIGRSLSQFFAYQIGKPWYNVGVALSTFVLNIILALVFIPQWGIIGAALASLCSYGSMAILTTIIFSRTTRSSIGSIYRIQADDIVLMKQLFSQVWSLRR